MANGAGARRGEAQRTQVRFHWEAKPRRPRRASRSALGPQLPPANRSCLRLAAAPLQEEMAQARLLEEGCL